MSRALSETSMLDRSTSDVKRYLASQSLKGSLSLLHISVPQRQSSNKQLLHAEKELLLASEKGNWDAVELLTNTGVDVDCRDWFFAGIWWVVIPVDGQTQLVCVESVVRNSGYTPLHWSASVGHADVAALLICKGAHVDSMTLGNKTPLYCAAHCFNGPTIALLLEAGADVGKATQDLHDDEKTFLATYVYTTTREALTDREHAQMILTRTFAESTPKLKCESTLLSPATASSHDPTRHHRAESAPLKRYNSEPKILIPASPKATTPSWSNFGTILESSPDISSVRALYSSEPSRHVAEGMQPAGIQPVSLRGHSPRLETQALIPHSRYQSEAHAKLAASVMGLKGRSYNGESLLSSGGGGLDSVLRARHNSAKSLHLPKTPTPIARPVVPSLPLLKHIDLVAVVSHASHAPLVPQQPQQQQQEIQHRIQQHILQQAQQVEQPQAQQQAPQQAQQQMQQRGQQQAQHPQLFKPLPGPSGSDTLHSWLASLNQSPSPRPHSHNPPTTPPHLRYPSTRSSQSSRPGLGEPDSPPAPTHQPHSYHEHVHKPGTTDHHEQERRTPPRQLPTKHSSNTNMEHKPEVLIGDKRSSPPQGPSQPHRQLTHKQELAACLESQRRGASPPPPQRFPRSSRGIDADYEQANMAKERRALQPPQRHARSSRGLDGDYEQANMATASHIPQPLQRHARPSRGLDGDYKQANMETERRTPPQGNHFQAQIDLLQAQLNLDTHVHDSSPYTNPEIFTERKTPPSRRSRNLALDLSAASLFPQDVTHPPTLVTRQRAPRISHPKPSSRPTTILESRANQLLSMDISLLSESSDSYPPLFPCASNPNDPLAIVHMTLEGATERYLSF